MDTKFNIKPDFSMNRVRDEKFIMNGNTKITVAPSLEELKTRQCTVEELQAALVKFIDLYNEQGKLMQAAINKKQDREWRATI